MYSCLLFVLAKAGAGSGCGRGRRVGKPCADARPAQVELATKPRPSPAAETSRRRGDETLPGLKRESIPGERVVFSGGVRAEYGM